ncbi:DUF3349 domain-containing protein [Streptacidiphilus sp. N1-3]|uniref:DUF3349 domain-containing protein n=1 Tax=Streptacidiphilus alkalitolerans TaxID=3342712 RepID=A0ABV6X0X7_9ACTN
MPLPPVLSSIVGWLRAGYPEGVPEHDYIPLFALLSRQLSEAEVNQVVEELAGSSDPVSAQAIHEAAAAVVNGQLLDSDVARVSARLAAGGWPLARPDSTE